MLEKYKYLLPRTLWESSHFICWNGKFPDFIFSGMFTQKHDGGESISNFPMIGF